MFGNICNIDDIVIRYGNKEFSVKGEVVSAGFVNYTHENAFKIGLGQSKKVTESIAMLSSLFIQSVHLMDNCIDIHVIRDKKVKHNLAMIYIPCESVEYETHCNVFLVQDKHKIDLMKIRSKLNMFRDTIVGGYKDYDIREDMECTYVLKGSTPFIHFGSREKMQHDFLMMWVDMGE